MNDNSIKNNVIIEQPKPENSEKKTFSFIKKKIQNEEPENQNNLKSNKLSNNGDFFNLLSNQPNKNDNPTTFNGLNNLDNTVKKENTEKQGFSFIRSSTKSNQPEKKGINYDLFNEIYSQSLNETSIINNPNPLINNNNLIENFSNLNINNNQNFLEQNIFNQNNFVNNVNNPMNNNNFNDLPNTKKSSYHAPNLDLMFTVNSGISGNDSSQSQKVWEEEKNITKTNDQFDFLSDLKMPRNKNN